jgi:hypothetical protein
MRSDIMEDVGIQTYQPYWCAIRIMIQALVQSLVAYAVLQPPYLNTCSSPGQSEMNTCTQTHIENLYQCNMSLLSYSV